MSSTNGLDEKIRKVERIIDALQTGELEELLVRLTHDESITAPIHAAEQQRHGTVSVNLIALSERVDERDFQGILEQAIRNIQAGVTLAPVMKKPVSGLNARSSIGEFSRRVAVHLFLAGCYVIGRRIDS